MNHETALISALGITVLLAGMVVGYLQRPLRRMLIELCGNEDRAGFWLAFSSIMLLLTPVTAELIAGPPDRASELRSLSGERAAEAPVLAVCLVLRWGLLGLVIALFCVAMGVAAFLRPGQTILKVDADQTLELERLLTKVLEMRAREIVDRAGAAP